MKKYKKRKWIYFFASISYPSTTHNSWGTGKESTRNDTHAGSAQTCLRCWQSPLRRTAGACILPTSQLLFNPSCTVWCILLCISWTEVSPHPLMKQSSSLKSQVGSRRIYTWTIYLNHNKFPTVTDATALVSKACSLKAFFIIASLIVSLIISLLSLQALPALSYLVRKIYWKLKVPKSFLLGSVLIMKKSGATPQPKLRQTHSIKRSTALPS